MIKLIPYNFTDRQWKDWKAINRINGSGNGRHNPVLMEVITFQEFNWFTCERK